MNIHRTQSQVRLPVRLTVRPTFENSILIIKQLSVRCAGCHLLRGIAGRRTHVRDPSICNSTGKATDCQAVVTLGFRWPSLHPCAVRRNVVPLQPQFRGRVSRRLTEKINVVRRLLQTTSLTAVRMAVSSVSRQLPTCLPRTLDLGAATDGDAYNVPRPRIELGTKL